VGAILNFWSLHLQQRVCYSVGCRGETNAGLIERNDFRCRRAFAASDEGPGVELMRRQGSGRAGDESGGELRMFGSMPAVLWNPQAHAAGVSAGQFGFAITGPANGVIVVEACTNLSHPVWIPVGTNTLSWGGVSAFSDPQWKKYSGRYYRFASP
jgi:hypothetical protein